MMRNGFLLSALLLPLLSATDGKAEGMDLGGQDLLCAECPTSNWYAGFEAAILKPHLGSVMAGDFGSGHPVVNLTPQSDYEISPRIWLGWDSPEGIGARLRYWQLDADATQAFNVPAEHLLSEVAGTHSWVEADTLDAEATLRGCWGKTSFLLGGGFRYATLDTGVAVFGYNPNDFIPVGMDFEGAGLTVAVEANRPFGNRGLALVGGFRQSWIYGDTDAQIANLPVTVRFEDHMMQISEASLGIQWSRYLSRGATLTAAAVWEVQAWEWSPMVGLVHQDVGFSGPTLSLSLMR
jgi:hypothetical protein